MSDGTIDYDRWYPEVPAVMDTKQLAELLNTNEQVVRSWVRERVSRPTAILVDGSSRSCGTRSSTG